jgi:transcriptional regulator with XRE-family HTH domain
MLEKRIADRIHQIRKSKELTLAQLGDKLGLSKGLLSRIENNQVAPPIGTLAKIAQGLGVPISIFFDEDGSDRKGYAITRKNSRKQVVRRGTKIGFTYYSLTSLKSRHVMEAFIVKYPVVTKEATILFDYPGEKLLFVLKGEIELVYGRDRIRLKPGDAVHFDPSTPHRGQNVGKEESECLVVIVNKEMM